MRVLTLPFHKLSPGGNPTILVQDNSLFSIRDAAARRAEIARMLMDSGHLGAEQVGFLDTSRDLPHMEMMGGEFCVNATRSAALVFATLGLLPAIPGSPGGHEGEITTSGIGGPVRVRTAVSESGEIDAAVAISLPSGNLHESPLIRACGPGETLVRLPGITHLLVDAGPQGNPRSPLKAAASKRAGYGLENEEAVGIIWYGSCPGTPESFTILPVVHVAATGSSVVETACGSGSLALALFLASQGNVLPATIRQPSGGLISVIFEESPAPSHQAMCAWVNGPVHVIAQGLTHILL